MATSILLRSGRARFLGSLRVYSTDLRSASGAIAHAQRRTAGMFSRKLASVESVMISPRPAQCTSERVNAPFSAYRGFSSSVGDETLTGGDFEYIGVERDDAIAVVELRRHKALNALSRAMAREVAHAMRDLDDDPNVRAIVITGGDRAFAAGADITELGGRSYHNARFRGDDGAWIDEISKVRTPVIAAVSGFALGGGCELAMAADIIIASEDAVFGQPEVQIGCIPGWGGTQRLIRAVGKAKAMEMILTGRQMTADEAERAGLVSRVARKGEALNEARAVASVIARHSFPVVVAAKECVNVADEVSLSEGLRFERRAFQAAFALDDHNEGVKAFVDKRTPHWSNK